MFIVSGQLRGPLLSGVFLRSPKTPLFVFVIQYLDRKTTLKYEIHKTETKEGRSVYKDWTHEAGHIPKPAFLFIIMSKQMTDERKYFKTQMNR